MREFLMSCAIPDGDQYQLRDRAAALLDRWGPIMEEYENIPKRWERSGDVELSYYADSHM